jgi:hypothetical protein
VLFPKILLFPLNTIKLRAYTNSKEAEPADFSNNGNAPFTGTMVIFVFFLCIRHGYWTSLNLFYLVSDSCHKWRNGKRSPGLYRSDGIFW